MIRASAGGFSGQGLDSRGSAGFGGLDSRGMTPLYNGQGGLFSPRAPGSAQIGLVRGISSQPLSPKGEMVNVTSAPDLVPVLEHSKSVEANKGGMKGRMRMTMP